MNAETIAKLSEIFVVTDKEIAMFNQSMKDARPKIEKELAPLDEDIKRGRVILDIFEGRN